MQSHTPEARQNTAET